MERRELLTGVVCYIEQLGHIAVSSEKNRILQEKLNGADSDEERAKINQKYANPPPPSSMPDECPLEAAILILQKFLRELGLSFPDPPAAVKEFFKEKNKLNKLFQN